MIDLKTWGSSIKYYDQSDSSGERGLFYGAAGSGKTHLIGTAPRPFVVDIDHGGKTLSDLHIPFVTIPQEKGAMALTRKVLLDFKDRQGLFAPGQPLEDRVTLGFDGYSSLTDIVLWELSQRPGSDKTASKGGTGFTDLTGLFKPEMDHWQALRVYLLELTNILEDIAYKGFNVIATATAFIKENEQVRETQGLPEIQGGFKDVVGRKYDYVIYLECKDGRYLAHTKKKGLFIAKVRRKLPDVIENPTFESLFGKGGDK